MSESFLLIQWNERKQRRKTEGKKQKKNNSTRKTMKPVLSVTDISMKSTYESNLCFFINIYWSERMETSLSLLTNKSDVNIELMEWIDDIVFEFLVMHCDIGKRIRQKKISQEYLLCRKSYKTFVSFRSPPPPIRIHLIFLKCDIIYSLQESW